MKRRLLFISIIAITMLGTFGCANKGFTSSGGEPGKISMSIPTDTPTPTITLIKTYTSSSTPTPTNEPTPTSTPVPTVKPTSTPMPTPIPISLVESVVSKNEILKKGDIITITSNSLEEYITIVSVTYTLYDENDKVLEKCIMLYDSNQVITEITIPERIERLKVEFKVEDSNGATKTENYEYNIQKPVVAITIDDGPTDLTKEFLDVVEEYGIKVTFFEVGYKVSKYEEDVKRAVELGCQIGTHTYGHANLNELSAEKISSEIERGSKAIYDVIGTYPTVCRLPFGAGSTNQDVLDALGLPSIYWTIDTRDWESKDPVQIMEHVTKVKNLDGYMILIHSTHETTLEAFKEMVPYLIQQGYELVTVDQMAMVNEITLEPGKNYRKLIK